MHYLQFFVVDRAEPILVPVSEECGNNIISAFRDRTEPLRFFEFGSVFEHHVWMNGMRLQMVRFLLEMDPPPFDLKTIGPSKQFADNDNEEPDLCAVRWEVTVWIRGRREPLVASDLSGHDWIEIYTSCDCDEQFLVVTDEDGEELAIRVDDLDMLFGLELERYSNEQLEAIAKLLNMESPNQSMKQTPKEFASRLAPFRNEPSMFATTPSTSSRFPASLVRLKLVRCPHSLAPTLVALPSMPLDPPLHSLRSHTPAVLLFNDCRGLSLSG